MKNNALPRLAAVLTLFAALLSLCACGKKEDDRPALTVWVYDDEYKEDIERAFEADMSSLSWRLNVVTVTADELDARLAAAEEDGALPDVFMLSPDNLSYYIESGLTAGLAEFGFAPENTGYYPYTTAMSTNSKGELKAICLEPDPGLFFYRRSIAKAYLGTDEPAEVQKALSTWDGFLETARVIGEKSNGATRMLAGAGELVMPYMFSDPEGWVNGEGKFAVSQRANELFAYAALLHNEELIYDAEQWSEAWLAGMQDPQSIFGYFSSGIGMESILRRACGGTITGEGSFGDWAAVPGPAGYNWGGCWLAMSAKSEMKQQAATFLEYFFSETQAMQKNCLISGSFSPSKNVVEQIKFDAQFSDSFLSGQNYYAQLAAAANNTTAGKATPYDTAIDERFTDCLEAYACGYKSLEQALDDLYNSVSAAYPELF